MRTKPGQKFNSFLSLARPIVSFLLCVSQKYKRNKIHPKNKAHCAICLFSSRGKEKATTHYIAIAPFSFIWETHVTETENAFSFHLEVEKTDFPGNDAVPTLSLFSFIRKTHVTAVERTLLTVRSWECICFKFKHSSTVTNVN